ncbi:MAG: arginine--tRNA ligase [Chloroflexi bacterium]|nr:arginine--tRNA ligase [Chloroflexota bacterium]
MTEPFPPLNRRIAELVRQALMDAQKSGALPQFALPEITVEHPRQAGRGDFASSVALQLASVVHRAPIQIARTIVDHLPPSPLFGSAEAAPPGFVNFTLDPAWLASQVPVILEAGQRFGALAMGQGRRVQVEYVSANPTGPLTMGSGRNAVLGDGLANVLEAAGYQVQREYYVNDRGTQTGLFAETLFARYAQALGHTEEQMPENGYHGHYMVELGQQIAADDGDRYLRLPREQAMAELGRIGLERMVESIRTDLAFVGISYDRWFSEVSLYEDGAWEEAYRILQESGLVEEREGAVWFLASRFDVAKDEVLIRTDGRPTYFGSDVAYHYDKFCRRGFDWVIDVWGADHQGHVPRMKAVMQAFSLDPERLTLLLYQLVTLRRGGELVRLSKRTGDIITLREVVEEIGADAVRFFLLSRAADSQMDLDLDLAKEQSNENPVYYVQYAHARIASILRNAAETEGVVDPETAEVALLTHPSEQALIRQMLQLPEIVEMAAAKLAPHHLAYYASELASSFHAFYRDCRVLSSDPADAPLTAARLQLVRAAKGVLARVLTLMGMTAPESM